MPEMRESTSELWRAARRGAGWALGFGAVLGAASTLSRGPQTAVKASMKGFLRAREAGAELAERMQDLYAEAQSERFAGPEPDGD